MLDGNTVANKPLAVCKRHWLVCNVLEAYHHVCVRRRLNFFGISQLSCTNHFEFGRDDQKDQLPCISIAVESSWQAAVFKEVFLSAIINCMWPQPELRMLSVPMLPVNVGVNGRFKRLHVFRAHILGSNLTFAAMEDREKALSWQHSLFFVLTRNVLLRWATRTWNCGAWLF